MEVFPADICMLVGGYGEQFDAGVIRTEMERGPPKERVANSRVMMELSCALLFNSTDDVGAFEDWYFVAIKRIGWFQVTHPRTGVQIVAKFKGGAIGALVPVNNNRRRWRREVTLEYLR